MRVDLGVISPYEEEKGLSNKGLEDEDDVAEKSSPPKPHRPTSAPTYPHNLSLPQQLNPELSAYRDRRFEGSQHEFDERLRTSTTLYVGNLSFFSSEEQLLEVFSKAGDVLRVIMGLDKQQRTPCGFAFGEERGRTLPCVCVSLGGVERGKGGGRGGEDEGREGEKLIFFDTKKNFF